MADLLRVLKSSTATTTSLRTQLRVATQTLDRLIADTGDFLDGTLPRAELDRTREAAAKVARAVSSAGVEPDGVSVDRPGIPTGAAVPAQVGRR